MHPDTLAAIIIFGPGLLLMACLCPFLRSK